MSLELVQSVKDALLAEGQDLSGPCGAFKITKRVATLAPESAGLYSKPSGNNCEGFAVDILAYPDGQIRDILVDGGGENRPAWGGTEAGDPTRYRAVSKDSEPDPNPDSSTDPDHGPWEDEIAALKARVLALEGWAAMVAPLLIPKRRINTSRVWGHSHEVEI